MGTGWRDWCTTMHAYAWSGILTSGVKGEVECCSGKPVIHWGSMHNALLKFEAVAHLLGPEYHLPSGRVDPACFQSCRSLSFIYGFAC